MFQICSNEFSWRGSVCFYVWIWKLLFYFISAHIICKYIEILQLYFVNDI